MPRTHGTTTERGYDSGHQLARLAYLDILEQSPGSPCHHYGQSMYVGMALDLDHTPTRDGYLGLAHSTCSRADGARRGDRARRYSRHPPHGTGRSSNPRLILAG